MSSVLSKRITASLSSALLLIGAFLIGAALHAVIVTNAYTVTSPAAVLRIVVGIMFIWAGYRLRTSIADLRKTVTDDSHTSPETDKEDTFDPKLSPLSEDGIEQLEDRDNTSGNIREREDE